MHQQTATNRSPEGGKQETIRRSAKRSGNRKAGVTYREFRSPASGHDGGSEATTASRGTASTEATRARVGLLPRTGLGPPVRLAFPSPREETPVVQRQHHHPQAVSTRTSGRSGTSWPSPASLIGRQPSEAQQKIYTTSTMNDQKTRRRRFTTSMMRPSISTRGT